MSAFELRDHYRQIVESQPECSDAWFESVLNQARRGDDQARRTISESCLRYALQVAEGVSHCNPSFDLSIAIQEANAALQTAIAEFAGNGAAEFIQFACERIERHLDVLVERRVP